jgi:hypothetical protein
MNERFAELETRLGELEQRERLHGLPSQARD